MEYYLIKTVVAGILSIDMTLNAASYVNTITTSTNNIRQLINCINVHPHSSDVVTVLKTYDVEMKIRVFESVIKNLRLCRSTEPLTICLSGLKEIIDLIETELCDIYTKLNYNHSLWICKNLRSHNFDKHVATLLLYNNIFDIRKETFLKILEINDELTENATKIDTMNYMPTGQLIDLDDIEKVIE
jgi:hypothetical protein